MKKENKSERVIVHVRMRPFSEEELKHDNTSPIESFDTVSNTIGVKKDFDKKTYSYDTVLNMNIKQREVFEKTAKEVVDSVIKGYNGTIFAYGQTGTGKTHTMVGNFEDENNKGIIPRTFTHVFDSIKNDKDYSYNISIAFIQIYLESIQDLLEPSNENIRIREDPENGVYLEGVEWIAVKSPEDCRMVFLAGEKNRTVASTKMNAHSSRSHAIMIVKVEKGILISPEKIKEIANISPDALKNERVMTKSMLYLVDLAGSERVKKTGADSVRLNEAKKINFSLLVLGNCIKSLSDAKGGHVSYRDSKLTRLLQESLGGNAKTSLIVTISPSSYNTDETISSLGFGQRAMKVQNKPQVNKSVDYQALCIKLQEDLDKLNDEYSKLKIENDKLAAENIRIKNGEVFVEMQRKSICVMDQSKIEQIIKASSPESSNIHESPLEADINKQLIDSPISISDKGDSIKNYNTELKKLEAFYEQLLKNKDLEYEKILIQVDNELSEKENENEELKNKNMEITNKYNILVDLLKDYESEKEDSQKSIIELTNKLEENKKASEKFVSQLKKLQAIKPEDQIILSQLGSSLNSNNKIISDILSKELCNEDHKFEGELNQNLNNFSCKNCNNKTTLNTHEIELSEGLQSKFDKLGYIDSINFTNKFIEILRDNDFDLERFRENQLDKTYKIKILDLENLMVSIIEEKKELKTKTTEIQTLLTTRDSKIKDLIEKDQKASILIEDLRKEKLSLQNKINELNELSLIKENLSIEKLDKQESYYKLESQKKEEEIAHLKNALGESLRKVNELENSNDELKGEIEKKNDTLFEFKNTSIDKNQLQIYYSELCKNADNFISEKQKILDKNISLFKDVEESINKIKLELKDLKIFYEKAEFFKRNLNESINYPEALNIDDPSINIFRIFQNNIIYVNEMEKVIEDFEENLCKIEDEVISNFSIKKVSLLNKSSNISTNFHTRNNSVFVNNKKNSIICRVENLNTTTNSNSNNKANISSDSNSILTDENVSNFDSNGANSKSKISAENPTLISNTTIRSNVDFDSFNRVFMNFIENIESINTEYLEIINGLIDSQKFLMGALKQHRKIISQQNHDFSSLKLEIDLSKKNENFLKNSIIYLQQCSLENFFNFIPKEEVEEILINLNNLSSTIGDLDAPDVIKLSSNILNETNIKLNNFLNEKNLIIENLNEKINYLIKEIEMLKNVESTKQEQQQDKKEKVSNAQVQKLQAQLKFKEEEIARLNERIEEHLKTINKLSKEQTLIKNVNSYEILTPEKKDSVGSGYEKLGFEGDKATQDNLILGNAIGSAKRTSVLSPGLNVGFLPGIANNVSANVSMSSSPIIRRESSIIDFKNNKNSYEDEIRELRQHINEQKNTYETQIHKKEISYKELERIHDIESIKKTQKDANTGRYLIKDYLLRTQNFVDELFRYLNPSD